MGPASSGTAAAAALFRVAARRPAAVNSQVTKRSTRSLSYHRQRFSCSLPKSKSYHIFSKTAANYQKVKINSTVISLKTLISKSTAQSKTLFHRLFLQRFVNARIAKFASFPKALQYSLRAKLVIQKSIISPVFQGALQAFRSSNSANSFKVAHNRFKAAFTHPSVSLSRFGRTSGLGPKLPTVPTSPFCAHGLQTARNFSSGAGGRVFDHLVVNEPLAVRLFGNELQDENRKRSKSNHLGGPRRSAGFISHASRQKQAVQLGQRLVPVAASPSTFASTSASVESSASIVASSLTRKTESIDLIYQSNTMEESIFNQSVSSISEESQVNQLLDETTISQISLDESYPSMLDTYFITPQWIHTLLVIDLVKDLPTELVDILYSPSMGRLKLDNESPSLLDDHLVTDLEALHELEDQVYQKRVKPILTILWHHGWLNDFHADIDRTNGKCIIKIPARSAEEVHSLITWNLPRSIDWFRKQSVRCRTVVGWGDDGSELMDP